MIRFDKLLTQMRLSAVDVWSDGWLWGKELSLLEDVLTNRSPLSHLMPATSCTVLHFNVVKLQGELALLRALH